MSSEHIYYKSDAYSDIYVDNTNSSFRNNINQSEFGIIKQESRLVAAVTSFSFTLKNRLQSGNFQLGLRSSFPSDPCIRSSFYDNLIYTFSLLAGVKTSVICNIPPSQLFYLRTSKARLATAKFEIINLQTNSPFDLINGGVEPTLIEVIVKPQIMNNFSMVLESNDPESLKFYPENNNMDFTIQLPLRKELEGEDWSVLLKGIQLSGGIWNIQDESFTLSYLQYFTTDFHGDALKVDQKSIKEYKLVVKPGYYRSKKILTDILNEQLKEMGIRVVFIPNNFTKLKSLIHFNDSTYIREKSLTTITLSPNIANFLGFSNGKEEINFNLLEEHTWVAQWDENLNIGLPSNLFVQMDLLSSRIVGRNYFPILQLLNINKDKVKQKIIHFIIRENNSAHLKTKCFSKINVKISDSTGKVVKGENDFPTILHLNFINFV